MQVVLTNGILIPYLAHGTPDELDTLTKNCNVHTKLLTNNTNFGPGDEVIRLLYGVIGAPKLLWGSEFATYKVVGPPFCTERYAEIQNHIRNRYSYLSVVDLQLIHGGHLQRIFRIDEGAK